MGVWPDQQPPQPPLKLHRAPRSSLTLRWGRRVNSPPLPTIVDSPPAPPLAPENTPATASEDSPGAMRPTDPRWVLAVRTSQLMQGDLVRPDDREQLIRTGRLLGLNAFESNLVIAIMQDQARRGLGLEAAVPALRFVPIHATSQRSRQRRWLWHVAAWTAAAIATELLLVYALI